MPMLITKTTFQSTSPNLENTASLEAQELSKKLMDQLEGRFIGYYRNSTHSLSNLAIALNEFSKTNNLDSKINATSAQGMGSWPQPDTVGETFQWAINPKVHGGIIQTIAAMKESHSNLEIAQTAEKATNFLKKSGILKV